MYKDVAQSTAERGNTNGQQMAVHILIMYSGTSKQRTQTRRKYEEQYEDVNN